MKISRGNSNKSIIKQATNEVTEKISAEEACNYVKSFIEETQQQEDFSHGIFAMNVICAFVKEDLQLEMMRDQVEPNGNWVDYVADFAEKLGKLKACQLIGSALLTFTTKEELVAFLQQKLDEGYFYQKDK